MKSRSTICLVRRLATVAIFTLAPLHAQTNTATGSKAGSKVTSGKHNTADGFTALQKNKAGSSNTAVGSKALKKTTGSSNVGIGFEALFKNKGGDFNVAIGDGAMKFNVDGNNNVALGMDAGSLTNGSDNILIDHVGVAGESGTIRIGTDGTHKNTFIAGKIFGDGSGLTNVPASSLTGNINLPASTNANTGLLLQAGSPLMHTYGNQNFFAGRSAGNFSTTASHNTATGRQSLSSVTSGGHNTASGHQSLASDTTGAYNTAIGDQALFSNTTGNNNVASGYKSLFSNTSGINNIALGTNAGFVTNGSNNILIGHQGVAGESGKIRIGSPGTHTETLLSGNVGVGTTAAGAPLEVRGSSVSETDGVGIASFGPTSGLHLALDHNEIMAYNGNTPSKLYLGYWGGGVDIAFFGGDVGVGSAGGVTTIRGTTALEERIQVPGAGVNTNKSVFIHKAEASNILGNQTIITHPMCDRVPGAMLFVTPNWSAGESNVYVNHPIGVYYASGKWRIFTQDSAAFPVNAHFNVMIVVP